MLDYLLVKLKKLWQTDPNKVCRPSGISRRHFLQAMGVTTTSIFVGGNTALWAPAKKEIVTELDSHTTNELLFQQLSLDKHVEKKAIDAVNDFTRTKMREAGFFREILPPLELGSAEKDRLAVVAIHGEVSLPVRDSAKLDTVTREFLENKIALNDLYVPVSAFNNSIDPALVFGEKIT